MSAGNDLTDDDAWALEERFWTAGADHYDAALHADAVLVFPPPAGIMRADAAIEGLAQAPRWRRVSIDTRTIARPEPGTVVLAYRARAERDGGAPYEALCSSTYVRAPDTRQWHLAVHQQTPV